MTPEETAVREVLQAARLPHVVGFEWEHEYNVLTSQDYYSLKLYTQASWRPIAALFAGQWKPDDIRERLPDYLKSEELIKAIEQVRMNLTGHRGIAIYDE